MAVSEDGGETGWGRSRARLFEISSVFSDSASKVPLTYHSELIDEATEIQRSGGKSLLYCTWGEKFALNLSTVGVYSQHKSLFYSASSVGNQGDRIERTLITQPPRKVMRYWSLMQVAQYNGVWH